MISTNFNGNSNITANLENYTKTSTYNISTGANESISVIFENGNVTINQNNLQTIKSTIKLTEFQAHTLIEILQKEFNYNPNIIYRKFEPEFDRTTDPIYKLTTEPTCK